MNRHSPHLPALLFIAVIALVAAACSNSGGATTTSTTAATGTTATTTTTVATAPTTTTTTTPTTTTPATGANADALAAEAAATCDQFASLPFPQRNATLDQQAGKAGAAANDLLHAMETACPHVAKTFEDLQQITSLSAQLGQGEQALSPQPTVSVLQCNPHITAAISNDWNTQIGIVAALYRGDASGNVTNFEIVVYPSVTPGDTVQIDRAVGSTSNPQCGVTARAYLATPGSDATDTWQPTGEQRALPDTSGDNWLNIMQTIIDTETQTHNDGLNTEFGMTEDVRSADYAGLVSSTVQQDPWPATQVTNICDATTLTDGLVNITFVATRDGNTYTSSGLFRRSPQDGRWRWLQLAFYLSDGNACSNLEGVSLQATGTEV
jgi:hypothetical protein